jgi:hypothetical protein
MLSSPGGFATRAVGTTQKCIYIDETNSKLLYLGRIGNPQRFCVAEKSPYYSHCGISAHSKGSTGSKKFKAKIGTFYAPGGPSTLHPTAKVEPFIHRDNVPHHLLSTFKKGMKTSTDWEQLIVWTMMAVETMEADNYKDKAIKGEEDQDDMMEDNEFKENSTIMLGMDEGEFKDIEIKFEWEKDIKDSDWAPTPRAHYNAIKLLVEVLKAMLRTSTKELKALERRMRSDLGPKDIKARAALQTLVRKHSSLAGAVVATLDLGESNAEDMASLQDEMNKFHHELQEYLATANVSNGTILQVVAKMQEMLNSRHANVRARVA